MTTITIPAQSTPHLFDHKKIKEKLDARRALLEAEERELNPPPPAEEPEPAPPPNPYLSMSDDEFAELHRTTDARLEALLADAIECERAAAEAKALFEAEPEKKGAFERHMVTAQKAKNARARADEFAAEVEAIIAEQHRREGLARLKQLRAELAELDEHFTAQHGRIADVVADFREALGSEIRVLGRLVSQHRELATEANRLIALHEPDGKLIRPRTLDVLRDHLSESAFAALNTVYRERFPGGGHITRAVDGSTFSAHVTIPSPIQEVYE